MNDLWRSNKVHNNHIPIIFVSCNTYLLWITQQIANYWMRCIDRSNPIQISCLLDFELSANNYQMLPVLTTFENINVFKVLRWIINIFGKYTHWNCQELSNKRGSNYYNNAGSIGYWELCQKLFTFIGLKVSILEFHAYFWWHLEHHSKTSLMSGS